MPKERNKADGYREKAYEGDTKAMNNLGVCYERGTGVKVSLELAFEWYMKTAELDDVYGCFNVGECYYHGKGVEQSAKKALEWYMKAAGTPLVHRTCQYQTTLVPRIRCRLHPPVIIHFPFERIAAGFPQTTLVRFNRDYPHLTTDGVHRFIPFTEEINEIFQFKAHKFTSSETRWA